MSPAHPRSLVSLWLAAATLALLFLPLFALFDSLQGDASALQAAIVQGQASRSLPVSLQELEALRATAGELCAMEEAIQALLGDTGQAPASWLAVLQRIMTSPGSDVRLTGLTQREERLLIEGSATSDAAVAAYAARLRGSQLFEEVRVENAAPQFAISLWLKVSRP